MLGIKSSKSIVVEVEEQLSFVFNFKPVIVLTSDDDNRVEVKVKILPSEFKVIVII